MVQKAGLVVVAVIVIAIIAAAAVYLASQPAPSPTPTPTPTPAPTPTPKALKVAVLVPQAITDASWNAAMYDAATKLNVELKDQNIEISTTDSVGQVDVDSYMRRYAEMGYNIILGWTIGHQDSALRVAKDFPNVYFIGPDWWKTELKNVASFQTPLYEGAYLAGLVAAALTKTNVVGFVDGEKYPNMLAVSEAFRMGAEKGGELLGKTITTVRGFALTWDDVAKGREVALSLIDTKKADVILTRGGPIAVGAIQACSLRGVYAIGDVADQYALDPKIIVTSNVVNCKQILKIIIDLYQKGKLENKMYLWGLAEGTNDIAPFYDHENKIPQIIKDEIAKTREGIKNGTIKIPFIGEDRGW
jgi:basic membrane lipoprotein Med (substrate-binding protein (PBP1-ABC) superfamily)